MATNYDKFEYDLIQAESLDDYFKHLDAGQNLLPIGGIQLDDLPAVKIGTTEAKEVREILGDLPLMLRNIKNSYLTVDLMPSGIAYDNTSLNNVLLIKLDIANWFDLLYNTAKREDIVTNIANLAIARDKTVELNEKLNEKLTNYENKITNDALRDADEQLDNADNSIESSEETLDKLEHDNLVNAHLGEERHKEDEQAKDGASNNDGALNSHQDSASNNDDASDSQDDTANSDQDSASNDTPSDGTKPTSNNTAENQANTKNDENSQDDTANSDQDSASNDTPSDGTKPTSDNTAENQTNTKNDENSQDDTSNSDQDSASNDTPSDGTKPTSDNTAENQTNTENDEQAKDGNASNSDQDSASSDTPSDGTKPTNPDNSQNTDSTNNADGTDGDNASSELDDLEKENLPHNVTNNVTNRSLSAEAQTEMAKQDDKLQQVKTAAENAKANINPESQADVPSVKMQIPPVQVTNSTGQDTQTQLLTKMMETLNLVLKRETKKDKDTQAPKAFSELTPNERLAKFRSEQDQLIASMIAKQI